MCLLPNAQTSESKNAWTTTHIAPKYNARVTLYAANMILIFMGAYIQSHVKVNFDLTGRNGFTNRT